MPKSDGQITEIIGRNRLIDQLLLAGLEVAIPARDHGIDLIAFSDRGQDFYARPIQMKAATAESFSINKKYEKFPGLLLAHIWHVQEPEYETYVLTYAQALHIGNEMHWTSSASWLHGEWYTTTRPGKKLKAKLQPYRATPELWKSLVESPQAALRISGR